MGAHRPGRRPEVSARPLTGTDTQVVRVLPDVPALDRALDYEVPDDLAGAAPVGAIVRIPLHGRRVRGWVVDADVEPEPGLALKPVAKLTGHGPAGDVIDLARWAAWRWAGRAVHLLRTASPERAVRRLPEPRFRAEPAGPPRAPGVTLARRPPAADPDTVVAAVAGHGSVLVVAPTLRQVDAIATAARRRGHGVAVLPREWAQAAAGVDVVVGTRVAVWATVPELAAIVVVDEHEESLQQEQAPTWHAREVAVERARRADVPCVLWSPAPSLAALARFDPSVPSRTVERSGWPIVDVIDRRDEAPGRLGLFSDRLVPHLRDEGRVLCVLNRTGRAKLLACASCGELARCERCDGAVAEVVDGRLDCRRCEATRPKICARCGSGSLKNLRLGVGRAREELEALVREPVAEVTATSEGSIDARVVIGTEAVLHRFDSASVVAFLDVDQELVAPRYRAGEQAMALLVRAARLLGPREAGGRLVVQTRLPDHDVLQAVLHADPGRLVEAERARRRLLGFPPFTALAAVSGAGAEAFVDSLPRSPDVEVLGPSDADGYLIRAADSTTLADHLAEGTRPPERLRLHVDPSRI